MEKEGKVTLSWKPADGGCGVSLAVKPDRAAMLTAPDEPALLEVKQGERPLLWAGSSFADVREADFTKASSTQDLVGTQASLVRRHSP